MRYKTIPLSRRVPESSETFVISVDVVQVPWQICDEWTQLQQFRRGQNARHFLQGVTYLASVCFGVVGVLLYITGVASISELGVLCALTVIGITETHQWRERTRLRLTIHFQREQDILHAHGLPLDPNSVATDELIDYDPYTRFRFLLRPRTTKGAR